jgi:ubiquinol-cytochrome c reductase core subunit 2
LWPAHEFHEDVERSIHLKQAELAADATSLAIDSAHAVAFHTGLGASLYPARGFETKGYLNEGSIAAFAEAAYIKPNIALVADGASQEVLSKWVDGFFKDVPATSSSTLNLNTAGTKYYGGEQRTSVSGGNSMVLAFPGATYGSKPELSVLAALLGGQPTIKWTPGFAVLSKALSASPGATATTLNMAYSDTGLFAIQVSGSAAAVRTATNAAVKAIKSVAEGSVSKEDLTKAIAKAKFDALEASQLREPSLVAAGTGIIHHGTPLQSAETVQAIGSVTADKLKAVSISSQRQQFLG